MSKNIASLRGYLRNIQLGSLTRDLIINKVEMFCYWSFEAGIKYALSNPNASRELIEHPSDKVRLSRITRVFEPEEINKEVGETSNQDRPNR